jgi:hypothetical protein
MEINNSMTATPLYPNQPSLAPPIAVCSVAPTFGTGRGQKSVLSTTGQMGVAGTADHGYGTTVARIRATKQTAPPRGVPR